MEVLVIVDALVMELIYVVIAQRVLVMNVIVDVLDIFQMIVENVMYMVKDVEIVVVAVFVVPLA